MSSKFGPSHGFVHHLPTVRRDQAGPNGSQKGFRSSPLHESFGSFIQAIHDHGYRLRPVLVNVVRWSRCPRHDRRTINQRMVGGAGGILHTPTSTRVGR